MPEPAPRRLAVIDLGTNTFHLLIADVSPDGRLTEVYRERRFVKLAADGIETIGPAPFARGIDALRAYRAKLDEYGARELRAFGTAALRTASNGEVFVRTAELEAGIPVHLIPGDEEARLITRGVLAALPPLNDRILIMDIGGGSTEFIIAGPEGVHWRRSFPIGVAVLFTNFHRSDPLSEADLRRLHAFLGEQLAPLAERLAEYPTHHLVGAAGTFDVLAELLRDPTAPEHPTSHALRLDGLDEFYYRVLASDLGQRLALEGVPEPRAEALTVAMVLLRFVVELAGIERITVSDYAMKEGILAEM